MRRKTTIVNFSDREKVRGDLTPEQAKAFRLADNKVGKIATWDFGLLGEELAEIKMDMDMGQFGFETADTPVTSAASQSEGSNELNVEDFADDKFKHQCPRCGFKFD